MITYHLRAERPGEFGLRPKSVRGQGVQEARLEEVEAALGVGGRGDVGGVVNGDLSHQRTSPSYMN